PGPAGDQFWAFGSDNGKATASEVNGANGKAILNFVLRRGTGAAWGVPRPHGRAGDTFFGFEGPDGIFIGEIGGLAPLTATKKIVAGDFVGRANNFAAAEYDSHTPVTYTITIENPNDL